MSLQFKRVALTGADTRPRTEMERIISAAGGINVDASQIRRMRPDYIVVGYRPGNVKLDAGERSGAKFIIEEDLIKMIDDPNFEPRSFTRTQVSMYATTLTNKGKQTERTVEFLREIAAGSPAVTAVATANNVVNQREVSDSDEFSIADFFDE